MCVGFLLCAFMYLPFKPRSSPIGTYDLTLRMGRTLPIRGNVEALQSLDSSQYSLFLFFKFINLF